MRGTSNMNKKVLRIIGKIAALAGTMIGALVSLLYFFTNCRLLFSGDWAAYANPAAGFFHHFFTILMYAFIIASMVITYFYFLNKKHGPSLQIIYWIMAIGLLAVTTLHIIFNKLSFSSGIEGYVTVALHLGLIIGSVGSILYYLGIENPPEEKPIEEQKETPQN